MSIARSVLIGEPVNLDWLEIGDEDGKVWRYVKRNQAADGAVLHVGWRLRGTTPVAALIRGQDGKVVLRQDEPGLPAKIVVDWIDRTSFHPGSGFAAPSVWGVPFDYEQVKP